MSKTTPVWFAEKPRLRGPPNSAVPEGFSRDFRFGMFELQPRERRLLKAGNTVSLGPRAFDVLICLVERAGHLVTKEQLFSHVWPKVVVDDSALQAQISSLRKILGSDVIATISGQGYRFVLEVSGDPCRWLGMRCAEGRISNRSKPRNSSWRGAEVDFGNAGVAPVPRLPSPARRSRTQSAHGKLVAVSLTSHN